MTYTREQVQHMVALLYPLLQEAKDHGYPKAVVQVGDIHRQEWTKDLSSAECTELAYYAIDMTDDLHFTKDQPRRSAERGVMGYSYTDDEGLLRLS